MTVLFSYQKVAGQYVSGEDSESVSHDEKHKWKNAIGFFSGTTIVNTTIGHKGQDILFVPTYGIDYAREFNNWLGFGIHNEFELERYIIQNEAGEELERSYIYVGSVLLYLIPIKHLAFFVGPGYEFTSSANFNVFRMGAEYAIYRGDGNGWYIAPEIAVDWVSNIYNTYSIGFSIGRGF